MVLMSNLPSGSKAKSALLPKLDGTTHHKLTYTNSVALQLLAEDLINLLVYDSVCSFCHNFVLKRFNK